MKDRLLALALTLLLVATAATAQSSEGRDWLRKADQCYSQGLYDEAAAYYLKAAELHVPEAEFYVGYAMYKGEGFKQDYAQAAAWFKRAADQGNAKAQYNLAYCYLYGQGVEKNPKKAFKLIRQAARGGLREAQLTLAECYATGTLTERNQDEADRWYAKAGTTKRDKKLEDAAIDQMVAPGQQQPTDPGSSNPLPKNGRQ